MPPNLLRIRRTYHFLCSSCAKKLQWQRTFSNTASLRVVGPENPRYVTLPEPPQLPKPSPKPIKGILPIPRTLFGKKRNTKFKTSPLYIDKTSPEPSQRDTPQGPNADRLRWQQRMSDLRRLHFREGLKELASRKETMESKRRAASVIRRRQSQALVNAPEREDERLTKPTITADVRALLKPYQPRGRTPEEFMQAQQNYARHQTRQTARRREALHNLYMHARSFILTEQQLNDAVEKTFGSDEDPIVWGIHKDQTIWGLGPPATVEKMLNKDKTRFEEQFSNRDRETLMQSRLRRIAEVLTGGKMDVAKRESSQVNTSSQLH